MADRVVALASQDVDELDVGVEEPAPFADGLEPAVELERPCAVPVAEKALVGPGLRLGIDVAAGPLAAFVSTASVARKYCSATLVSEMRAYTRVMRGVRCPNRAAMASRLMPRLKLALGGQGVAKLVGVDVADAGPSCGPFYGPGDHVAVEGLVVGPLEQQAARRRPAPGAVVGDKAEEQWVQRYVAVVVELAHGDAEPVSGPDAVDGVVAEGDQLPDAHARAGRQLDHETSAAVGLGGKGGHELGRARVV